MLLCGNIRGLSGIHASFSPSKILIITRLPRKPLTPGVWRVGTKASVCETGLGTRLGSGWIWLFSLYSKKKKTEIKEVTINKRLD
jgi:hypothetical protein